MKKTILMMLLGLMACLTKAHAQVDPNFYIYICFGQSNMEGNAQWEAQDVGNVDERFQMLATCNFDSPKRTLGNWYKAVCPIVSPMGKLGVTDYFGRTMVKELPDKKIGVIAVAMGGSPIEMFDKNLYQQQMKDNPSAWWATLANWYYAGNPYGRIIEMAKKAQQVGVIKGILLHQGETNNGQADWPQKVKKIYKDMLHDLGLRASDVPLFVGEVVGSSANGTCAYHNTIIAKVPSVIPTAHVISSEGCPAVKETDGSIFHFSAEGYRILGRRYAEKALDVMNHPETYVKYYTIDERLTGTISDLAGKTFAIVNEAEQTALYCPSGQQMADGDFKTAFDLSNEAYMFKLAKITGGRSLRLVDSDGEEYQVNGVSACLNSQAVTGDCCFANGLNGQRGYEIADGAVWKIEYVDGKGWSMLNVGTGKYLKDTAHPAMFDEPTYFTFCTLKQDTSTGIEGVRVTNRGNDIRSDGYTYNLSGQRVGPDYKGIVIKNGKKYVIK